MPPVREHWARDWSAVVVLGIAALAAFALVGEDVLHHETTGFDTMVRSWVLSHRPARLISVFFWITTLGSVTPMVVYACIGAVMLWMRGRPIVASTVLVAPAVAVVAYLGLKNLFMRVRPSGTGNVVEGTYSFPSAHATTSAAICCTLAYVFWRERLVPGYAAVLFAVLVPLLIGASRVYLDAHWATDILGGWCAGVFVAALSAGVYSSSRRIHPCRQQEQE